MLKQNLKLVLHGVNHLLWPGVCVNCEENITEAEGRLCRRCWEQLQASCGGDIPVPTPVVGNGLVYITNAHGRMSPIYAVRLSAAGDISPTENSSSNRHIAWSYSRGGNYIPTPIVYGDYLYCGSDSGRLSCFEAKTGKLLYRERLSNKRGAFSASPVGADGKIYFTGEKGDIYVVKAGPEFKLLGVNEMNETCIATPAISQGTLYFRTRHHLVAIAENTTK